MAGRRIKVLVVDDSAITREALVKILVPMGMDVVTASTAGIAQRKDLPLEVWIKVDAGYGRTGVPWQDQDRLRTLCLQLRVIPRLFQSQNLFLF